MSQPMTMKKLGELLNHIRDHHSFCRNLEGQRYVKYVDPKIDTRDWMCFAIVFRNAGNETVFHTQNECRDLEQSLFERVMEWLDGGEQK
jgi:hypothetical protein